MTAPGDLNFEVIGDARDPGTAVTPIAGQNIEVLGEVGKPIEEGPNAVTRGIAQGIQQIGPGTLGSILEAWSLDNPDPGHARQMWKAAQDVKKWGEGLIGEKYASKAKRLEDVANWSDFATIAGEQFGQGMISTFPVLAGGMIGGLVGGAAAGPAAPAGAAFGAGIGMIAPSYAQNFADLYESFKQEGLHPRAAKQLAKLVGIPVTGLDVLPAERVVGNLTGNARNEAIKGFSKRLVNALKEAGVTGGMEATTEAAQQAIQELSGALATGKDPLAAERWWNVLNAGLGGLLVGSATGVGGGFFARNPRTAIEQQPGQQPPAAAGSAGLPPPPRGLPSPEAPAAGGAAASPEPLRTTPTPSAAARPTIDADFEILGDVPPAEQPTRQPGQRDVVAAIEKIESGGDPFGKPATSSATGYHGFIDSTWMDMVRRYRPDLLQGRTPKQVLALRYDHDVSTEIAGDYANENQRALAQAGLDPTPPNTYLAHFLGAGGAKALLNSRPGTTVDQILPQHFLDANPGILTDKEGRPRQAGYVVRWATARMRGAMASHGITMPGESPDLAAQAMAQDQEPMRETHGLGPDPAWVAMAYGMIPPAPDFDAAGFSSSPETETEQKGAADELPSGLPGNAASPEPGTAEPAIGIRRPGATPQPEERGGPAPVAQPGSGRAEGPERNAAGPVPQPAVGERDIGGAAPVAQPTEQAGGDAGPRPEAPPRQTAEASRPQGAAPPPAVAPVAPQPTLKPAEKGAPSNADIEKMFDEAVDEAYPGEKPKSEARTSDDWHAASLDFAKKLDERGAARSPDGDYKIIETPNSGFAVEITKDGIRTTLGGGYPAAWTRKRAIQRAVEDAFPLGDISPPNDEVRNIQIGPKPDYSKKFVVGDHVIEKDFVSRGSGDVAKKGKITKIIGGSIQIDGGKWYNGQYFEKDESAGPSEKPTEGRKETPQAAPAPTTPPKSESQPTNLSAPPEGASEAKPTASSAMDTLAAAGITFTPATTPAGKEIYNVTGITREMAAKLRDAGEPISSTGLRFFIGKKLWYGKRDNGETAEKLLRLLRKHGLVAGETEKERPAPGVFKIHKWHQIGVNGDGDPVLEDQDGIRAYNKSGKIFIWDPANGSRLFPEYKTEEELGMGRPQAAPAEKAAEAPAAPSAEKHPAVEPISEGRRVILDSAMKRAGDWMSMGAPNVRRVAMDTGDPDAILAAMREARPGIESMARIIARKQFPGEAEKEYTKSESWSLTDLDEKTLSAYAAAAQNPAQTDTELADQLHGFRGAHLPDGRWVFIAPDETRAAKSVIKEYNPAFQTVTTRGPVGADEPGWDWKQASNEAMAEYGPELEPKQAGELPQPAPSATLPQETKGAEDGGRTQPVAATVNDRAGNAGQGTGDVSRASPVEPTRPDTGRQSGPSDREREGGSREIAYSPAGEPEGQLSRTSSGSGPSSEHGMGDGDIASMRVRGGAESRDYLAPVGSLTREGSWLKTAERNLDIVELVDRLDKEGRLATPDEQALIAKFTGWGASEIRQNLFKRAQRKPDGTIEWDTYFSKWDEKGKPWQPLVERAAKILTGDALETALQSTQYAHYTSEGVIRSIWSALQRFGFSHGRIIEPGMGTGLFAIAAPKDIIEASKYVGIEMDKFTAKVATHLLPTKNVINADYVEQKLPDGFFDAAIGNPPFSRTIIKNDPTYRRYNLSLHNYFFAKTLDKVRPGGVLAFVTSRYTMDAKSDEARKFMAERADLLGAIRLPQTAFKGNAGTEVVTDVLFLQRRAPGQDAGGEAWNGLGTVEVPGSAEPVLVNEYFVAHPEMVLGKHATTGSMYRSDEYTVEPREGDIEEHFRKAIENLPKDVYSTRTTSAVKEVREAVEQKFDFNPKATKEGSVYVSDDGDLMVLEDGRGKLLDIDGKPLKPEEQEWLRGYVDLRGALKQAQADQLNDGDWKKSLKRLNSIYDAFVKKHGPITGFTVWEKRGVDEDGHETLTEYRRYKNQRLWELDVESPLIEALERVTEGGKIIKGPILLDRVLMRPATPKIETTQDALFVSLDQIGRFDPAHIASLAKSDVDTVLKELGDLAYETPSGEWQLADEYLSGDVRTKLAEAKIAAAGDDRFKRNVEALYGAQPLPLDHSKIDVQLGAGWIPQEIVNQFASEVLGIPTRENEISFSYATGKWTVPGSNLRSLRDVSEWSTRRRSAEEILEAVLNKRELVVKDTYKDENDRTKTVVNKDETAKVNEIAENMRKKWQPWLWKDAPRTERVVDLYNDKFNNIAPRSFNGDHLTLPGLSNAKRPYPHQKRAIWRIIQTGNTYLAHAVGAGKTLEMICAGVEMKRLGLIKKPMYVVPNHMLNQFAREFMEAYPQASIMVADERQFHTSNRRRFMAQAALNDPDAIIITHSSFGKLPVSKESIDRVVGPMIAELEAALRSTDKSERVARKNLEQQIENLKRKIGSKAAGAGKDTVLTFEEMGVDFLFVDEAHMARKLDFLTDMGNVKGISPIGSAAALDLYVKQKYLERLNPGRSAVFASGTPITNTMAELYSVMRFMNEQAMYNDGIAQFDQWASMYGRVASEFEQNAAGDYEFVARFRKFENVPELMNRVRQFMDVLTMDSLGNVVDRPTVEGGRPENVVTKPSSNLNAYMKGELRQRIDASRKWKPSKEQPFNPDPMIAIGTDARLASIDMRLIDPKSPNDPNSKLNKMIDEIIARYHRDKGMEFVDPSSGKVSPVKGATQIVFSALGLGEMVAKNRGWSPRDWMMKRFKEAGIPATQIAWRSDYNTHAKREAMFKEMREGKKRILIGSPQNMGTGLNVQTRLKSLHYLAPPWYPADVEQPHGRIIRQGNLNPSVELLWYATKGTYDSTQWGMVASKARFIQQALTGDASVRRIDDVSEVSQYEMASALAAGDDRAIRLAGLSADIERLTRLRRAHYAEQEQLKRDKWWKEGTVASTKEKITNLEAANKIVGDETWNLKPNATIAGVTYDAPGKIGNAIVEAAKRYTKGWLPRGKKEVENFAIGRWDESGINIPISADVSLQKRETANKIEVFRRIEISIDIGPLNEGVGTFYEEDEISPEKALSFANSITRTIKGIENRLRVAREDLREAERELKQINSRLGAPFDQEKDLNDKIAEAQQLQQEMTGKTEDDLSWLGDAAAIEQWESEGGAIVPEREEAPSKAASQFGGPGGQGINPEARAAIVKRIKQIVRQIVPSADVSVFDEIPGAPGVAGYYDPLPHLVEVALRFGDPDVAARHESIHALRTIGLFTDKEWALMERDAKSNGTLDRVNDISGYDHLSPDEKIEEAVAQTFGEKMAAGEPLKMPAGPLRTAWEKIKTFFRRLGNAIRGLGFKTVEDVYRSAEEGQVGARQTYPAEGTAAMKAASAASADTSRAAYVMREEKTGKLRVDLDAKRKPGESLVATVFGEDVIVENDRLFEQYLQEGIPETDRWKYGIERLRALAREHEATLAPKYSRFQMDDRLKGIAEKTFGTTDRSLRERLMDWGQHYFENGGRRAIQQIADTYRTWYDYERAANDGALEEASRSAYKGLRMAGRATPDVAYHLVYKGPIEVHATPEGGVTWRARQNWAHGGLKDIVEPLADRGILKLWELQRVTRRAVRLDREGREKLLKNVADSENMTIPELAQFINQQIAGLTPDAKRALNTASQRWEMFNSAMLDFAQDTGLISAESRSIFENADYIPFYRIFEEADQIEALLPTAGGSNSRHIRSPIKKLRGGEGKINPIVENMIANATSIASRGIANLAKRKAFEFARSQGLARRLTVQDMMRSRQVKLPTVVAALRRFGWDVDLVPKNYQNHLVEMWLAEFPDSADVASVMVDGKPVYYRFADPDLMAGIVSVRIEQFNDLVNLMAPAKRLLTRGVTATPGFMARNFVRDTVATWMMTGVAPGIRTMRAALNTARRDPIYWEMMAGAATGGGFYSSEAGDLRRRLDRDNAGRGWSIFNIPKLLWEWWTRLGEISEIANRRSIYDWVKNHGGSDAEAAYHAVDLLDFGLRGASHSLQSATRILPFLNARVEGLYRMYRAFEDPTSSPMSKGIKQRVVAGMVANVLLRGLFVAAFGLMLEALSSDDPDYQDLPDWKKDTYWYFKGGLMISKPFEFGFVFSTIPQRIFRLAIGDDRLKDFGASMLSGVMNTLAFNPTPQAVLPVVEQLADKSFFPLGAPVVPQSVADLSPEYQYMPYTGETARQIGKATGTSPVRIERLIRGYTGDLGMYVLAATDGLLRAALGKPEPPAPPIYFGETYGILDPIEKAVNDVYRSFHERKPLRSTKSMEEFYALRSQVETIASDMSRAKKTGDFAEVEKIRSEHEAELQIETQVRKAAERLSKLRKQQDQITEGTDTPVQKREALDKIQQERNDIAREFMQRPATLRVLKGIQEARQ